MPTYTNTSVKGRTILYIRTFTDVCRQSQICSLEDQKERTKRGQAVSHQILCSAGSQSALSVLCKQIANIETEEQLEEIGNTFEIEEQLEETGNTSEKHLSGGHTENHIPKKNTEEDFQSNTSTYQVLTEKHNF
ncbi:hypothetical protein TNCV_489721 [Trichonephila clavipes]|nr:hypothetical protein TNCV_489721 [Trichonephila clavipes]